MKIITPADVRPDVLAYLEGWYDKAKKRQEQNEKEFLLSFGEFLNLWGRRRLRTLAQWMDDGSLYARNRKSTKTDPNLNGYVLSPISFAATQQPVRTAQNMQICTRGKALQDCKMKKGDKHSEKSKARISNSTKGKPKSAKHRAKIAASCTGVSKGPMDDAGKLARSDAAKAYWARRKAEEAAAQIG
ncbi:hypothetical protein DM806_20210 [Sphingobium lactosutens]|uniref:hypothetical protein n=1 Tax=Sphingobium lactosutens TaxID=522773 RepID=UPI0015BC96F0|nr:hypothetical protein [Sphingobium lactosutens]NWK97940.1 hypothetical protein [Sphingobium lactosutens]